MGQRDVHAMKYENENPKLRLNAALSILYALEIASKSGRGITLRPISQSAAMSPASAEAMLQSLKSAYFVNHSRSGTWFLTQSLSDTTLHELQMRLGLTPDPPIANEHATAWQGRYNEICYNILDTSEQLTSSDLKTFLEPDGNITIDEFKTSLNKTSMNPRPTNAHTYWLGSVSAGSAVLSKTTNRYSIPAFLRTTVGWLSDHFWMKSANSSSILSGSTIFNLTY